MLFFSELLVLPITRQGGSMIITGRFKDAFARVQGNLTSLDSQPLSKAALVIILFLDLFILTKLWLHLLIPSTPMLNQSTYGR